MLGPIQSVLKPEEFESLKDKVKNNELTNLENLLN